MKSDKRFYGRLPAGLGLISKNGGSMQAINSGRLALHLCWIAALVLCSLLYDWPTLMRAEADLYLAEKVARYNAWQERQALRDSIDMQLFSERGRR
jgi:hypothetical protein